MRLGYYGKTVLLKEIVASLGKPKLPRAFGCCWVVVFCSWRSGFPLPVLSDLCCRPVSLTTVRCRRWFASLCTVGAEAPVLFEVYFVFILIAP